MENNQKISQEVIRTFIEGRNEKKYVTAIEYDYDKTGISLIINDPEKGKYIETHKFKPFAWANLKGCKSLCQGDKEKLKRLLSQYSIKITQLRTDGIERLDNGFKFLIESKYDIDFNTFTDFFKKCGIYKVFNDNNFMILNPVSQFMIQTGVRMFKGYENYEDVHKLVFDIETEGLNPSKDKIINIGIKDNKGFEKILDVAPDKEVNAIDTFFRILPILKPDILSGYNSENFDFPFFEERLKVLGYDINDIAKTLSPNRKYKRQNAIVKLGGSQEYYKQTKLWGINVIDTIHAARRAKAINSEIKKTGLKYMTKFSKINKKNRVYVPGDIINKTYADKTNKYAFNDEDGDWYKISEEKPLKEGYEMVDGKYIVHRYLLDDLWETQEVDNIYNQANYLISKLLPTTFPKTATMGTAAIWKLIMQAWSYENGLAIPKTVEKTRFVGGLSRLLRVGYVPNVVKFDFTSLYPTINLRHDLRTDVDITNIMLGLLEYVLDERIKFKNLKKKNGKLADKLLDLIENDKTLSIDKLNKLREEIAEYKKLESNFDKKQLPLKILANSFFGSYGAPHLFNWGDLIMAQFTTCIGRQYFRSMVSFMKGKGYEPIVGDSVTHDTPIYIKYDIDNRIEIVSISDIFNENEIEDSGNGQERDFSLKPFKIWTRNGWKKINYVYRHKTDKKLYTITTKDRLVRITEDHSIFQNGKEIKPTELKRGSVIDICDAPVSNCVNKTISKDLAFLLGCFLNNGSASYNKISYNWKLATYDYLLSKKIQNILKQEFGADAYISEWDEGFKIYTITTNDIAISRFFSNIFYTFCQEKKVPYIILNNSKEIKSEFLNGVKQMNNGAIRSAYQTSMAGLSYILKELKYDYTLKYNNDYMSFDVSSEIIDEQKENEVHDVAEFVYGDNFVYDVSTEDGTFVSALGSIICHNTDGLNFRIPENYKEFRYVSNGKYDSTLKGKEFTGIEASIAEYNDIYMEKPMGLSIDEFCDSTINFSKKNYADLKPDGSIKLVGNTIKSSKMSEFISEFMDNSIEMLLKGKGYEFVKYYTDYVERIVNNKIPINKIASVSNVKKTIPEYKEYLKKFTKAGRPNSRQAYMELIVKHNLKLDLGDKVYYYNTGTAKSHADIKLDKKTNEVVFNCQLVPFNIIESEKDVFIEDLGEDYPLYNYKKYLAMFQKRVKPLLVCLKPDVRDVLINYKPGDVTTIKEEDCELVSGMPFKPTDQNDYEFDLMQPSDQEIEFWISQDRTPVCMEEETWVEMKKDYYKRKEEEKFNYEEIEEEKDQNDIEINAELIFVDYYIPNIISDDEDGVSEESENEEGE